MRKNTLKEKLARGETIVGCDLSFASPFVAELIGAAGFDFVLINAEYSSIGDEQVEHIVRAAFVRDTPTLVSVRSEGDLYGCRRMLDRGALGIVMPSVRSKADAEAFVRACKFVPDGIRDQCSFIQTNDFGMTRTPQEYSAFANQEVLCVALCENIESIAAIGDIAAVPGLDVVWIGAGNLAAELGWPGQTEVQRVVSQMSKAVLDAGKVVGAGSRHGDLTQLRTDGTRFVISIAHDLLRGAFAGYLEQTRAQ